MARTRISRPRSLSHTTACAPDRSAWHTTKQSQVDLPEPLAPETNVLPRSLTCRW